MDSRFICQNEQYPSRSPQAGTGRDENIAPIPLFSLIRNLSLPTISRHGGEAFGRKSVRPTIDKPRMFISTKWQAGMREAKAW
jgi:hypothetical protein